MRRLLTLTLICTILMSLCAVCSGGEAADTSVTMICLNAGKADCILLNVEGNHYLIDTGYKHTADLMLEMLKHEGVDRLKGVFLTHSHKDHYGGLTALAASSIPIDAFYAPQYCVDSNGAKHPLVVTAAKRGQAVQFLQSGVSVEISETARFDILGPVSFDRENENNNSLVMRLETPDGSILLTGDMKFEEERDLLKSGLLSRTDVLKVAFHGDNTSTSDSFLSAVRPRVGLISTSSAEEKDTPSKDTLYRLAAVGCETYVTQNAESAIRLVLDDGKITVSMENWKQD